jgi:mono/diheme cytochrome c family protein
VGRSVPGWLLAVAMVAAGAGCGGDGAPETPAERGRRVYLANCTACHNANPKLAGGIGPALAGSSEALVRAKVMRGAYPPGYQPKRSTSAMVPLPHLEEEIPYLAAYLESVKPPSIP